MSRLSYFIASIEKAKDNETANGRPSGTATITIAIAVVKKSSTLISVLSSTN